MFPKPEAIRLLDHVVCKPPFRVFLGRVRQNLTMRKHASETPRSRSCTQAFQGHQPRTLLGSVKDLFKITIIQGIPIIHRIPIMWKVNLSSLTATQTKSCPLTEGWNSSPREVPCTGRLFDVAQSTMLIYTMLMPRP